MKQMLKKYFVPHAENEYKPHFFRKACIGAMSVVAVTLLATAMTSSWFVRGTTLGASVLSSVLVDLTNDARVENNETPLVFNKKLETAAGMKAADMAEKNYFAHTSPEGLTPWHWFNQAGYSFVYAGENLAVDFTESSAVEQAWLKSPTHRANILNGKFTEIGIATKSGTLDGDNTLFVVQMFGAPTTVVIPNSEIAKPAASNNPDQLARIPTPSKSVTTAIVKGVNEVATPIETIAETDTFVAVKNTDAVEIIPESSPAPVKYSKWYERFIVFEPNHVNVLYIVFIGIILIALGIMIFVEIRQQHPKNIAYGVGIIGLLIAMVIVNYIFFTPVFAVV